MREAIEERNKMMVKVLLREGEGWRRERRGRNREERGEGEWHLVFGIEE